MIFEHYIVIGALFLESHKKILVILELDRQMYQIIIDKLQIREVDASGRDTTKYASPVGRAECSNTQIYFP